MASATKYYAGIGSRETPGRIALRMRSIAVYLELCDYVLRSGGAEGADHAFECGALTKEIYLPWARFNNHPSPLCKPTDAAEELAKTFHPRWNVLSRGAQRLHARNSHQIFGLDMKTPVEFVVCWTPEGRVSGGTGQAMRIAKEFNIPIYNLYFPDQDIFPK